MMTPASRQRRAEFLALFEQYCRVGELLPGSITFGDADELEEVLELLDELHRLSTEIYQVLAAEAFLSDPPNLANSKIRRKVRNAKVEASDRKPGR